VGLGFDTVHGEAGTDTLDFSRASFGIATMLTTYRSWHLQTDALVAHAWGIENLVGSAYGDYFVGNAEANRVSGGGGNDWLIGGGGADVLTGGAGADVFEYNAITEGLDIITDFVRGAGGDRLDIKDVLVGYNPATSNIDDFVQLTGGTSTTVWANADGAGTDFVALATLQDVAMAGSLLSEMLAQGNLIVS
jgi:Ca2+-binding RTX toxin-like protein